MTIDLKETSTTRSIRYLRCRKVQKGKPCTCSQGYFAEEVYAGQLENLLRCVELPKASVESLGEKLKQLLSEEEHVCERVRGDLERELESVERRQQNLLLRSLDDGDTQRDLYERVRKELAEEHARLTRELGRLRLRLDRIARILAMALEIAGCASRAFAADSDPEYQGLIARVIFEEVRMRDGSIVSGKLSPPLAYFRRRTGEKPLERLADLALVSAHSSTLMDGCEERPQWHNSLPNLRRDLIRLQDKLTPQLEADIETCYRELRVRSLLLL